MDLERSVETFGVAGLWLWPKGRTLSRFKGQNFRLRCRGGTARLRLQSEGSRRLVVEDLSKEGLCHGLEGFLARFVALSHFGRALPKLVWCQRPALPIPWPQGVARPPALARGRPAPPCGRVRCRKRSSRVSARRRPRSSAG